MPFITVTHPPKYPLTESEKEWLDEREWAVAVLGSYSCMACQYRDPDDLLCIFRRCPKFGENYRDSAEFEARVSLLLAQKDGAWEPCYHSHCTENADTVADCMACRLKHARLAVESEMEEEDAHEE